jgi:predicted transcriptional regulator of viral defense system
MSAKDFLSNLTAGGRYHFTTEFWRAAMNSSSRAAMAALRRLRKKGLIATPYRGFHVIVPPEYKILGCLPPDQFIPLLMEHVDQPYYVALLSAARYHGAAHFQPQIFQVMVPKCRPPIACGDVRVQFVARHNAVDMPTATFNTPRGPVKVSTPEAVAFDLVGYPEHAGGLDNVASLLLEMRETIDTQTLASIASLSPTPWAQRLGYLLDLVDAEEHADLLAAYVKEQAKETTVLLPSASTAGSSRIPRWKLMVNTRVEYEP